jgi:TonB family protein
MMFEAALLFAFLPSAPPPPVVSIFGDQRESSQQILSWVPGEVRCDGVAVNGAPLRPAVEIAILNPQRGKAVSYRFAIDADGRTRSIERDAAEFSSFGQDIGPALAASRFAAGAARENCAISYTPKLEPLASAPIADLVAYSIFPTGQKLPQEGWDSFRTLGNCRDEPRPTALLRGHPEFRKLKASPGARDWSLVGYDTDASGKPINVRIAHGTGNDELDAAAIEAIRVSRFTGGARTGCLYPYWRSAAKLAAPERPAEEHMRPAKAVCPAKVEWTVRPATRYPVAYRKRAIEGWAIVAFDTAPWGEVGNVKVLDAQPSADFGQQAMAIVRSGRVAPSPQGASGCVETVKFMMPASYQAIDEDEGLATD